MKLYHGSRKAISQPDVDHSRSHLDFGRGFYATSYIHQAEQWAERKVHLSEGKAVVNEYVCLDPASDLRVLKFEDADERWVRFVCDCRRGGTKYLDYDLIIGGVADDKVFYAVDMFFQGLWDMDTTLQALKFYQINDQWCFVSQRAIDELLTFVRSWEVSTS